jgi:hypothetical protein
MVAAIAILRSIMGIQRGNISGPTLSECIETWVLRDDGARAADESVFSNGNLFNARRSRHRGSGVPIRYKSSRIQGSKLTRTRQGLCELFCLSCSLKSTLAHTWQGCLCWSSIALLLIRRGTVRCMLCLSSLPAFFCSLRTRLLCGFYR